MKGQLLQHMDTTHVHTNTTHVHTNTLTPLMLEFRKLKPANPFLCFQVSFISSSMTLNVVCVDIFLQ